MRAAVRWRALAGRSRRPSRRRRATTRAHDRGRGWRDYRRDPRLEQQHTCPAVDKPPCDDRTGRARADDDHVCGPHVHARATQTLFTPVWSSIAILAHLMASAAAFMPLRGFGMLDVSRTTGTGQAYGGRCVPPTAPAAGCAIREPRPRYLGTTLRVGTRGSRSDWERALSGRWSCGRKGRDHRRRLSASERSMRMELRSAQSRSATLRIPPILLVMGIGASMVWWEDGFCRLLAGHSRFVIRYDHRDTGRSTTYEPGRPGYTDGDLHTDAVAVLDGYHLATAHLVGASAGGALVQLLALDFPGRVLSLVLISTSPATPGDRSLPPPTTAFGAIPAHGDGGLVGRRLGNRLPGCVRAHARRRRAALRRGWGARPRST